MLKKIFLFLFIFNSLFAQDDFESNKINKSKFIKFLQNLNEKNIQDLKVQLITVTYSTTVTTAFGHSAFRVSLGKQFEENDYYIDFGEYDESPGFIWRFLKGEAKFYITVKNMANAYSMWDTTGRGMYSSEFKFSNEQKKIFINGLIGFIEKYKDGYEYNNFTSNCVTYIRDLLGLSFNQPLKLETEKDKRTWRSRLLPYSNRIFWLRMEEKLLLDHDVDVDKNPTELIYLPYDLLTSLEDMKLVKDKELLHRDFWYIPEGNDILGNLTFFIFLFCILSQVPFYFKERFSRLGEIILGLISVIFGSFTLIVILFTSFPFMNETLMVLVFTPLDYFLIKKIKPSFKTLRILIFIRLIMLFLAFVLRISLYKQNIDTALFFMVLYFILYSYHFFKATKNIQHES